MLKEVTSPDFKEQASLTMGEVIRQTKDNFPEPRFRPKILKETPHNTIGQIDPYPYGFWPASDGTGTKPDLAERLYEESKHMEEVNPSYFEGLAFDVLAMVDGDKARLGIFLVGITDIVDVNSAKDQNVMSALAQGIKKGCDEGHFPLLNGETAELSYRTSGYGDTHVNWNATGIGIVVPEKLLLGDKLKPDQPVVAVSEESIRSNGLTKARTILETGFLLKNGFSSKEQLAGDWFRKQGFSGSDEEILDKLKEFFGHDALEQILLPWHRVYPDIARQLLAPSRLYGPLIYQAQGGIEGERKVKMVAAAHITGGGIPEKGKRMVESKRLGLSLDPVFPDPEGVQSLLELASSFPESVRDKIGINNKIASEQWNRGIGFMVVTENKSEAQKLIELADAYKYEAGIAGKVIDKPEIQWRGHTWNY